VVVTQLWALPALFRGARRDHPHIQVLEQRLDKLNADADRLLVGGISTMEAADNLARSMRAFLGVPEPLPPELRLFGPCPRCGVTATHLLGERDSATCAAVTGTMGPTIGRECRCCGHTWKEMLDA
jgi:hypothetical protein